jgi:hypothetical protein
MDAGPVTNSSAIREKIESSRKTRLAILLGGIVLSQLILYGPSLLGRRILLPLDILAQAGHLIPPAPGTSPPFPHDQVQSDLTHVLELERRLVASELRQGRWPAWDPGQYTGKPVLQAPWLSPLSILPVMFRSPVVLAWQQMLLALIAGVGFYLFCRRALGLGYWSAVITAWTYPMTGFFVFWLGYANPTPVCFMPWLVLAIDQVVRFPTLKAMAGLALATCPTLCTRQLDASAQVLLFAGAYAIWRLLDVHGRACLTRPVRKIPLMLLGGWLLGFGLAAPYVMPVAEYVKQGARTARRVGGEEERPPGGIRALPLAVLPDQNGATRKGTYPISSPYQIESLAVVYVGFISTLFLAPLAWRSRRHRSLAIFATAASYVAVAWALNIGGIVMILRLPGLNMMSHNRSVKIATFAILAMAAIGLESLSRPTRRESRRWCLLPAALLAALGGWWAYRTGHLPEPIATEIATHFAQGKDRQWLPDATAVVEAQAWFSKVYLVGACLAAVAAACWGLLAFLARWRWWLTGIAAAVMFADMLWFAHDRASQCDPSLYYPKVPLLEEMARNTTGRVIGSGCLPPGLAEVAGLRDVRGYDGVDPSRYVQLLMLAATPNYTRTAYAYVQWMPPILEKLPPDKVKLSPILDLLGVEHVIFRGLPPAGFSPAFAGDDYWALQNPSRLPRAFVPRHVEVVTDEKARLDRLASPQFDPRTTAYLEVPVDLPGPARGQAIVVEETPTRIDISVEMDTAGLVVLADRWDRGWSARLNEEAVPILVADHALRGVAVPPGRGRLTFTYEPVTRTLGFVLFGLTLTALAAIAADGFRRRIRRHRPISPA